MIINLNNIESDLKGVWWQHINVEDFKFVRKIIHLENYPVNLGDILIHKEIKEGERFPSVRYLYIKENEVISAENEKIKEILSEKLVVFIRKNKKLPYACKLKKIFKNGNAQVDYHPGEVENFALKIIPKIHGIEDTEKVLSNLEIAEDPMKSENKIQEKQWDIQSSRDPNKSYKVSLQANGLWMCTCPHYNFRKTECRHIKESKKHITR